MHKIDSIIFFISLLTLGRLLRLTVRYNAPCEVIQMLLDADVENRTLFEPGMYNQLPVHVACRCDLIPHSMKLLLDYDTQKKTLMVEDNAGRIALHVAYLRNSHKQTIQILLEAMIYGHIARVGLDMWKKNMTQFIKSMETHERDFTTSDKLEMTREVLKELLELAFLLELGIWRANCLSPHYCHKSMKNISELDASDHDFDAAEFKKERRIKSGAEIIIPGVLSFLEDEPIVKLMEQFAAAGYEG